MRATIATLVAAAVTAAATGCGGSSTPKPKPKPAVAAVQVTMKNGGAHPKVGKNWPLTLTVTHAGKPVSGTVTYEFLFGGNPVAHRGPYKIHNGHYHDELTFPAQAAGLAITFRAVVKTPFGTTNADQPVTVQKK